MHQDEGYDQTDERHVAIAEKISQRRRDQQVHDVKVTLSTNAGRRIFWRYLSECGIFRSSFTGNNTTFFNEGKREIGLKLLQDMNEAMPEAFLMMQQEEIQREAAEKNQLLKELRDVSTS